MLINCVQNEYDDAIIHFNIPKGSYVTDEMQNSTITSIQEHFDQTVTKPGISLKLTFDNLSKEELLQFCRKNTINCFFYYRQHIFSAGLAAVTDQAISSGKPLLVTGDCTFRHIHKYIDYYPNISIKCAIEETAKGVEQMKNDWSSSNFLIKFEKILLAS